MNRAVFSSTWYTSLCIGALTLLAGIFSALFIRSDSIQTVAGDVIGIFASAFSVAGCYFAWRSSMNPLNRKAWGYVTLAMVAWGLGTVIFSYYEVFLKAPPFPSLADPVYFLYYPFFILGILAFRGAAPQTRSPGTRPKAVIELSIAFVAGALGFGRLIAAPLLSRDHAASLTTSILATVYPALDMAVIWALFSIFIRTNRLSDPSTAYLLAGGGLSMTIADCLFGYQSLLGLWQSGQWVDLFYTFSLCLFGLAGIRAARIPPDALVDSTAIEQPDHLVNPWGRYIPLGIITAVLLSVGWIAEREATASFLFLLVGSLLIIGLLFFRMTIAFRENQNLYIDLHKTSDGLRQRTAEVEEAHAQLQVEFLRRGEIERQRRELETRVVQVQKLESLSVLAGGVAHDFNNLLTALMGNLNLAQMDLPDSHPAMFPLKQAEKTALRAADLTQQMLACSGQGGLELRSVNLNEMITEMVGLMRSSLPNKVAIGFDYEVSLPKTTADSVQLRQVIMNLMINASEACAAEGGIVTVRTGLVDADEQFLASSAMPEPPEPGRYVFLEVKDNGCGMTEDVMKRIFEPFFSTKFTGRGLGLAATLGIVRGHRGVIKVTSTPEGGSSFLVAFPAKVEPVENTPAEASREVRTVLVVEDEAAVRNLTVRLVEFRGSKALAAENGKQGIELFEQHHREIDVVLLDLSMPVVDGVATLAAMRKIDPTIPVFIVTGYSKENAQSRFPDSCQPFGFIQKPFSYQKLNEALDGVNSLNSASTAEESNFRFPESRKCGDSAPFPSHEASDLDFRQPRHPRSSLLEDRSR